MDGSITALDLTASSPSIQCTVANGTAWTLFLQPATSILKNGKSMKPEELKVGDTGRVRFAIKDGKHLMRTLEVTDASSAPVSSRTQ